MLVAPPVRFQPRQLPEIVDPSAHLGDNPETCLPDWPMRGANHD